MPDLVAGRADFGVCIHEGRFTYQESGLHRIADLGELWEAKTGCPLPLGGLVMRSRHDEALMRRVSGVISRSLAVARANPATALPAMRRYAQSMDDTVLMQHVDLYVNDWTVDLGDVGRDALAKMGQLTNRRGNSQERSSDLRVLD
jgi:1,4-dihydroxy-6-naphthoate synthase